MNKQKTNTNTKHEYLFESFLPYRESLNLARSLYGLLKLKKLLNQSKDIEEQIAERISFNMRYNFPDLKPPTMSEEEFHKMKDKENKRKTMTQEEIEEEIEEEAEELRHKIETEEIDIWDETPRFIPWNKANDFLNQCTSIIETKISKACNPKTSLLEKITLDAMQCLKQTNEDEKISKDTAEKNIYLRSLISLWDYAKISYENEPPYKIVFSQQVADALGFDPVMESINLQQLKPLRKKEKKLVERILKVCLNTSKITNSINSINTINTIDEMELKELKRVIQSRGKQPAFAEFPHK